MCGIVGYTGANNQAQTILLKGLQSLEYRGYDSSGLALFLNDHIEIIKAEGKLNNLKHLLEMNQTPEGTCGIGHTRWATHGAPTTDNAHPHLVNRVVLVHNGIIENYGELKHMLEETYHYEFKSQTDTEVASAMIDLHYELTNNKIQAIADACAQMRGSFAFAVMFDDEPNVIYTTRRNNPLILGVCRDGHLLASDVSAIVHTTKQYVELENEEIAVLTADSLALYSPALEAITPEIKTTDLDSNVLSKGHFEHFMMKEIHEQPAIARSLYQYYQTNPTFDFAKYDEILIIACGSALYAGMVAKVLIERNLRIPVSIEVASEFRYANPIFKPNTLGLFISQSGETADSVASLDLARQHIDTLALVNVENSQMARMAKHVIYTKAGVEVSVATTKAYFAQVLSMILNCGMEVENLTTFEAALLKEISTFDYPELVAAVAKEEQVFFLGRGMDYALCLEGALKLKEISYINAQAYQAGEMKHGTISLIQPGTIVIGVVTDPEIAEKTMSNLVETQARGAHVILLHTNDIEVNKTYFPNAIVVDRIHPNTQPLLAISALQLFAYEIAKARNCEIDQPRNLAKSVSVE
ncbi:MAG: glutamine--fructose-6-phosphate transaminase (isomerizing) [Erysipelotrichaceae bacterium]